MNEALVAALEGALAAGERAVVVTIIETHDSAPRKPGACLAVLADGRVAGTVGGGALERLAVHEAADLLARGGSTVRAHAIDGAGSDTGMICGGDVRVALVTLDAADLPAVQLASAALAAGTDACLVFAGLSDEPVLAALAVQEDGAVAVGASDAARSRLDAACAGRGTAVDGPSARLTDAALGDLCALDAPMLAGDAFVLPLNTGGRCYLFGAGHVGQALVPVLARLGWAPTVLDDRPQLARPELLAGAREVICGSYADVSARVHPGRRDICVCMTASHASDACVVEQLLACRPRYLGCLGSSKKAAFIRRHLEEAGFSPEEIARVHIPVGLEIGAETPAEIAISIAAEIIACVRGAA